MKNRLFIGVPLSVLLSVSSALSAEKLSADQARTYGLTGQDLELVAANPDQKYSYLPQTVAKALSAIKGLTRSGNNKSLNSLYAQAQTDSRIVRTEIAQKGIDAALSSLDKNKGALHKNEYDQLRNELKNYKLELNSGDADISVDRDYKCGDCDPKLLCTCNLLVKGLARINCLEVCNDAKIFGDLFVCGRTNITTPSKKKKSKCAELIFSAMDLAKSAVQGPRNISNVYPGNLPEGDEVPLMGWELEAKINNDSFEREPVLLQFAIPSDYQKCNGKLEVDLHLLIRKIGINNQYAKIRVRGDYESSGVMNDGLFDDTVFTDNFQVVLPGVAGRVRHLKKTVVLDASKAEPGQWAVLVFDRVLPGDRVEYQSDLYLSNVVVRYKKGEIKDCSCDCDPCLCDPCDCLDSCNDCNSCDSCDCDCECECENSI